MFLILGCALLTFHGLIIFTGRQSSPIQRKKESPDGI